MSCVAASDQPHNHIADSQDASELRLWRAEQAPGAEFFNLSPSRGALYPGSRLTSSQTHWFAWLDKDSSSDDYRWAIRHSDNDASIQLAKALTPSNESIEVQPLYLAKQYHCPTFQITETGRLQQQASSDPNQTLRVIHQGAGYVHGLDALGEHLIVSRECLHVSRPWIDLVFDLDETLVWADCGDPLSPSRLEHGYGPDCMADGVSELLRWIQTLPRVRIAFWSASESRRVRSLLASIQVAPNKTALGLARFVLSAADMTLFDPWGSRIVPAKDLRQIEADFSNVVLIDDKANALPNQQGHWLTLADKAVTFSNALLYEPLDPESLNAVGKITSEHPYRDDPDQKASLIRHLERRRSKPFVIAGLISLLVNQMENGMSLAEARAEIYRAQQQKLAGQPHTLGTYAMDWVWDHEVVNQGMQILRLFNPTLALPDFSWLTEGIYNEDLETDKDYVTFRGLCLYQHPATGRWSKRSCPD